MQKKKTFRWIWTRDTKLNRQNKQTKTRHMSKDTLRTKNLTGKECYIYTFSWSGNDTLIYWYRTVYTRNGNVSLLSFRKDGIVEHTSERNLLADSYLWLEGANTIYFSCCCLISELWTCSSAQIYRLRTTNGCPAVQNKRPGTCRAQIIIIIVCFCFWHKQTGSAGPDPGREASSP